MDRQRIIAAGITVISIVGATFSQGGFASCREGGYFDEHPVDNPMAKFQGPLSTATQEGPGRYTASWDQRDNAGGHSGRNFDIKLSGNSVTMREIQSNQNWRGTFEKDSDGFIQVETTGWDSAGHDMKYEGIGCFRTQ